MQIECFIITDDVEMFWFCFDVILMKNKGMLENQVWKTDHLKTVLHI